MKFIALAAAALVAATPAVAQNNANFVGVRAEVNAGVNDTSRLPDRNEVNYGAAIGFDAPVGDVLTIGIEATADNAFQSTRQYGVSGRVGFAVSPRFLVYGKAGYENYRTSTNFDLEGLRVGGGAEVAVSRNAYVKAEYRYSDLERDTGQHGALVGVGLRF